MDMGKLTVVINDEVERKLRIYIAKKYPTEIYGKLSEVIELALREFLRKENLDEEPTPRNENNMQNYV
jgi:hypothetical protein